MRSEVLRVHKSIGAATIYVTHDQVEAMTMGDRIAVLSAGTLQQYGPPAELYANPVNLFVARFIGSPEMNLYEAVIDESGALVLGSQRLILGQPHNSQAQGPGLPARLPSAVPEPGQRVIVGFRPEDLTLDTPDSPDTPDRRAPDGRDAQSSLTVDVRSIERLGSELHVFFSIDAQPPADPASGLPAAGTDSETGFAVVSHNGVARLDPRSGVRSGDRITLRLDPARLYFFDPATGQAVPRSNHLGEAAPVPLH
jgi:multiple sugar transport system ATP-binding protein